MIESVLENVSGIRIVICSNAEHYNYNEDLLTPDEISIVKDVTSISELVSRAITDLGGSLHVIFSFM